MPARLCALWERQHEGRRCPLSPVFGWPGGGTPPARPVSQIWAGRGSTSGPRAAFHPFARPGWGQFSFRRPQRGRVKGDGTPLPLLAYAFSRSERRRDRTGVAKPPCGPSLVPSGGEQNAGCREARRVHTPGQRLLLLEASPRNHPFIQTCAFLFSWFYLRLCSPCQGQAWRF